MVDANSRAPFQSIRLLMTHSEKNHLFREEKRGYQCSLGMRSIQVLCLWKRSQKRVWNEEKKLGQDESDRMR